MPLQAADTLQRNPASALWKPKHPKSHLILGYSPIMKPVKKQVFQRLSVGCYAPLYASLVIIFFKWMNDSTVRSKTLSVE